MKIRVLLCTAFLLLSVSAVALSGGAARPGPETEGRPVVALRCAEGYRAAGGRLLVARGLTLEALQVPAAAEV